MKPSVTYTALLSEDAIKARRGKQDILREVRATWPVGTELRVTIAENVGDKTNPQLRYYHGAIVPALWFIMSQYGYRLTEDEASECYQQYVSKTNKKSIQAPVGKRVLRVRLSAMTKDQMSEFIDEAVQWCAEHGQDVPSPQEYNEQ